MNELYQKLFDGGITTKTLQQFLDAYSSEQGFNELYKKLFDGGITTKSFEEFTGAYGVRSGGGATKQEEEKTPELSEAEQVLQSIETRDEMWREKNPWAGQKGDYVFMDDAIYDREGNVIAQNIQDAQRFLPEDQRDPDAIGYAPTGYQGETALSQEQVTSLVGHLKQYDSDVLNAQEAIRAQSEINSDPLQNRINNNTNNTEEFYIENSEQTEEDGVSQYAITRSEDPLQFFYDDIEYRYVDSGGPAIQQVVDGKLVGEPILKADAILVDERLGTIIDNLAETKSIQDEQYNRSKAAGAANIYQVKEADLQRRENAALQLMQEKNFRQYGIEVVDEGWEAGTGELTFKTKEGEQYKIDAGTFAANSQEELDGLNKWLRNNARDYGSELSGHLHITGVTKEQGENNTKEAIIFSNEFEKNKNLRLNEDRAAQDTMYLKLLDDAVKSLGIAGSFNEAYSDVEFFEQIGPPGTGSKTGRLAERWQQKQRIVGWIRDMIKKGAYPEAEALGFTFESTVKELYTRTTDKVQILGGTVNILKGYEVTDRYFGEQGLEEYDEVADNEIDYVAKMQFINQLEKAIKEKDEDGYLPTIIKEELMNASKMSQFFKGGEFSLEGALNRIISQYPEYEELLKDLSSFSEIRRGITASHPQVRSAIESTKKRELDGADIISNVYDSLEGSSSLWWDKQDFQDRLTEDAQVRYNSLDKKVKEKVEQVQDVSAQLENNSRALNEAGKALEELRFDGLTAKEAIDKISKGNYTTQAEVDAANAEINRIRNTYNGLRDRFNSLLDAQGIYRKLANDLGNDLDNMQIEYEDLGWYKEAIGDRVGQGIKFANSILDGAIDLGQGFIEIGGILGDVVFAGINSAWNAMDGVEEDQDVAWDWYKSTDWGGRFTQNAIDSWQEDKNQHMQATVAYDDIETWGDVGEYALNVAGSQLPQIALMLATSGLGNAAMASSSLATRSALTFGGRLSTAAAIEGFTLGTLGINAVGSKYQSLRKLDDLYDQTGGLYGHDYSLLEMTMASLGTGIVEGLSEKVTFKLLKGPTSAMSRASRRTALKEMQTIGFPAYFKKNIFSTKGIKNMAYNTGVVGQDFLMEGGSEAVAKLGENFFDISVLGEDKSMFEGVDEAFVTGLIVAGGIKMPQVAGRMLDPFRSVDTASLLQGLDARKTRLEAELTEARKIESKRLRETRMEELRDQLAELHVERANAVELDYKRINLFTKLEKKFLLQWDSSSRSIRKQAAQVIKDQQDGKITKDEAERQLADIQTLLQEGNNKKDKILKKYDPNLVDRSYGKYMKSVSKSAKYFAKKLGLKKGVNLIEGNTEKFTNYLDQADDSQMQEAIKQYENIINDETSTEEQKSNAQRHIDNINKYLKDSDGARKARMEEGGQQYGVFRPIVELNQDTNKIEVVGYDMFINKQESLTDGKFNTASHEFMHTILHNTIHQDPAIKALFGRNMLELLLDPKRTTWKNQEARNRFFQTMMAYGIDENGRVDPQKALEEGEEMMTNISQMLQDGDVKFNSKGLKRVGGMFDRLLGMTGYGVDYKFDGKEDIQRFIVNYSDSIKKNYVNRSLLSAAAKGITGDLTFEGAGANLNQAQIEAATRELSAGISFSKSVQNLLAANPDLLEEFDSTLTKPDGTRITTKEELLQYPHLMDEAYKLIRNSTKLDGLIRGMAVRMGLDLEGATLQQFVNEVKDNLSLRYLTQFDPAQNESLFGWMAGTAGMQRSALRFAVLDVMKEYATSVDTVSLDAQMDDSGRTFADAAPDTGATVEDRIEMNEEAAGLSIFLESINASPELTNSIRSIVEAANIDISTLTYKDTKKLLTNQLSGVMDLVAAEFGIPTKKILENKDLDSTQREAAQQFVNDNTQALIDMLPEGQNQSGMATGLPRVLLNNFYEKGERVKASEGRGTQGKIAQNKRSDITVEEFKAAFGINPDGTFNNNKKFDGALRAVAVQSAAITANQTLRQVAIDNATNPLSEVALLGDGKGALMFSKKGIQSFGTSINNIFRADDTKAAAFWTNSPQLAKLIVANATKVEDGKKASKERKFAKPAIQAAVNTVYKDILTQQELDVVTNAMFKLAMGSTVKASARITEDKMPVIEQQFVDGLLKLSVDQSSKLGSFFGTGQMTLEMKDPEGEYIAEMQSRFITFAHDGIDKIKKQYPNPQEQGREILRFVITLGQQLTTAAKIGGNRNQYFTGPLFIEQMWKSIPDLKFQLTDKGAINYSSLTYKGESILMPDRHTRGVNKFKVKTDADGNIIERPAKPSDFIFPQESLNVIEEWLYSSREGVDVLDRRDAAADYAGQMMVNQVKYFSEMYNEGKIGARHMQMLASNLLSNMNPVLARAAKLESVSEDLLPPNWRNMSTEAIVAWQKKNLKGDLKPVYEHMQQRVGVVLDLINAEIFGNGANVGRLKNYKVSIISKRMDDILKAEGLQSALYELQSLEDDAFVRYFNELTLKYPEWAVGFIKLDNTAARSTAADLRARVAEILQPKQEAIENARVVNIANAFSRKATDGPKGTSIWDFDDTLARTKSNVIFNRDGETKIVSAEDFATQGAGLVAEGWTPDFSEFNKVTGGTPGPFFDKALERAKKFGTKDTFILTARAAEAQPAIKEFLDALGLKIPAENIVGLGNSTGQAKANWILENIIGQGYNDIYFADDAMQNVDAVQEVLDQFDIKGVTQQAKLDFSRKAPIEFSNILEEGQNDLNNDFNEILEETKGIGREKRFSSAKARKRGRNKGKFKFFLPPSAEDFKGLIYPFLGKGKIGEKHHAWFKQNLMDPFSKGMRHLQMVTQAIADDIKNLKRALPEVASKLRKTIPGTEFTYQDAIRVYNWNRMGIEIPGLSQADLNSLVSVIKKDQGLRAFADGVNNVMQQSAQGNLDPGGDWIAGTIESDVADAMDGARQIYLREFIENADTIFSEENLNKIEAVFGSNHREALEDILYRMRTGSTRNFGSSRLLNGFMQWLNGSVGATMFFNARSAMLQMISNVNFINWSDNNFLAAAKAFANQPQYWADVAMIFNSPWLRSRRGGIGTDLNAAELLKELRGAKNPMKAAIAYLLKIGFTPTQIADSLAIATGGATMYRNRIKSYIGQGLTKTEAESKAYDDMRDIAEESQQSTREDKISQQQASPLGKMILAFQNVTMQYNRLMKRAAQDWINGRGDWKTHASKIVYYGAIQNLIFYGLQQALFAALFGDDEEDQLTEDKKVNLLNGMLDSLLRGSGIAGAVISTAKNTIVKFMDENAKLKDDNFMTDFNEGAVIMEALNVSPPIGIKARKIYSALRTWHYNDDVIAQMDKTDIDNPMYEALFNVTEAVTNAPLHRLYNKFMNIREAMDSDHETWKRVAMFLGWSRWSFGIQNQDVMTARDEIKEIKAAETEERREQKKLEREIEKAEEELQVIEDNKLDQEEQREQGATEVQCAAVSRSGKRCSNMALPGEDFCTIHMPVPQQQNEVQCSHIKKDGERCKMKTKNKSGKCYYHD